MLAGRSDLCGRGLGYPLCEEEKGEDCLSPVEWSEFRSPTMSRKRVSLGSIGARPVSRGKRPDLMFKRSPIKRKEGGEGK